MCGQTRSATTVYAMSRVPSRSPICRAGSQTGNCSRSSRTIYISEDNLMIRRHFLRFSTSAVICLAALSIAKAQSYPSRPVTIVVPSSAGSPLDVIARVVVERMRNALGQVVIIESVPGAAGAIGIGRVARARPDGSTVAFGSFNTHVVHGAVRSLPYDVINDFEPIALVTSNPQFISAKKAMPADDLKGLVTWLRENPDKASLGQT